MFSASGKRLAAQDQMPGLHNVYNALATVATAFELDIPFKTVQETLRNLAAFRGVSDQRRETGSVDRR